MQEDKFIDWLDYRSFEISTAFEYQKERYYGQSISLKQKYFLLTMMDNWAFTDEERIGYEARIWDATEQDFEELFELFSDPIQPVSFFAETRNSDDLTKKCVVWGQDIITLLERNAKGSYDYKTDHPEYKYFKHIGWKHPKFYSSEQRGRNG